MLLWLSTILADFLHPLHVIHYLTLRTILAALTALVISIALGPKLISWLAIKQVGQQVRDDGPKSHFSKKGTPTMGGALIILSITVTTLLWANLSNQYIWLVLAVLIGFGVIGWVDDYRKVIRKNTKGLPAKWKYFWQSVLALGVGSYLYLRAESSSELVLLIPYFKDLLIPIGFLHVILTYFVIVGSSNAVNLTDGLDGLAILPTVLVAGALGIFAYATGHVEFSKYLQVPFVLGAGELCVFIGALVGAGLGFLWFNTYPAAIFMGDVGALALGASLGMIAVIVHQEIILFIMGGLFVVETLSVVLQVASFKLRGKRIFKMAPIHHHFELIGWPEPRVVVRFWILSVILVLIGLASIKIR